MAPRPRSQIVFWRVHGLDAAGHAQFLETLVRLVRVNDNDEPIRRPLLKSEIPRS